MFLRWLVIGLVALTASWVVMITLARRIPPEALIEAWPAERRMLERLAPATATRPNN